jgi:penicillin amidase
MQVLDERLRARRWRAARRLGNALLALAVCAAMLWLFAFGFGTIPALGPALDPGHGAWASAAGGELPRTQTLRLPGLTRPAVVSYTRQGLASIRAASDDDLYLALGYVHATFRLTEMDLERRLGEGRLAQLAGPSAVKSDEFELRLGLLRTARQEWAEMPRSSPAAQALIWYARGVNDYLAGLRASGKWPAVFALAGVYPASWTPVDSLVVQGVLTQGLDFTTTPLDYALLEQSLGVRRTMAWFPVLSPNQQSPWDPGPYRYRGLAPVAGGGATSLIAKDFGGDHNEDPSGSWPNVTAGEARAAAAILAECDALPAGQLHEYPDSNAWAANGSRVAGGGAMLAGDPHLPDTLPSVWYQVALSAPGISVSGVTVPGMPAVVIGHNAHIAWSLTAVQDQATLFYAEQTSPRRPGQYFWDGSWRRLRQVRYAIPVRGGGTRRITVDIAAQGPVLTLSGQTVAVDWMGNVPSPDVSVLLAIDKAGNFAQFRGALADWRAPALNFVYADSRGNIGAIAAGDFPQVRHGDPWLPMPGTGADDVAGVIPYAAVPQVYDPPGHVIASANQRPVGGSYPYYLGTSADFFDPGYRADEEYRYLRRRSAMRPSGFAALQASVTDQLAGQVVPALLRATRGARLSPAERQAVHLLASWNDSMTTRSAAASIWAEFWNHYLTVVFQPWWRASSVPVSKDRSGLSISVYQFSLDESLEAWTLTDQRNPAFTPPGGRSRDAGQAMLAALGQAVTSLHARLGGAPASWSWGRLHSRVLPSLLGPQGLGYGPRPAGGDPSTVDAAYGGLVSAAGPSWRMIISWRSRQPVAEGIYPGGQSENPASPWYTNLVSDWWGDRYLPMPAAGSSSGPIRWELLP